MEESSEERSKESFASARTDLVEDLQIHARIHPPVVCLSDRFSLHMPKYGQRFGWRSLSARITQASVEQRTKRRARGRFLQASYGIIVPIQSRNSFKHEWHRNGASER